ncbi:hypothetical protein KI387_006647 [Taxus chinensis]|uniref:Serine incorporator n=1 Tax=Taxus chinensis TaxID=29808 RepID=A0AA38GN92_TAXCH|nr:hypothetical protein KI387_006647 [Taxus chinensis]
MGYLRWCWEGKSRGARAEVARYVYSSIFLLTNFLAWLVRDYSHNALAKLHYLKGCKGGQDCLGTEGVLRVSMGCFIFHFCMFITTVGATKLQEYRDSWHSGLWHLKGLMWISVMIMPFLFPPAVIQLYGEVARFGAGIFLLIQLVGIVKFITWWNDRWMSDDTGRCRAAAIMVSTTAYSASVCGIILMYIRYAPKASCSLNIFFVTWTLILLQIMTGISLHSKANAGLLASGLMGLYIVFLCWSAIRSEPIMDKCNPRKQATGKGDWINIVSFIIAVLAIVMAAFSAGIESRYFQFSKSELQSDDDVPYGYGFFHFVFSMGSMYFAMLFVGWNLHQTMEKWSIDIGWASTWVKIVNEWLAAILYKAISIMPMCISLVFACASNAPCEFRDMD